jgi:hypothetical protein
VPRIVDAAGGMKKVEPLRRRVCDGRTRAPLAATLEPMRKRLFDGCHLTRPVVELPTGAGFTIAEPDVFYEDGVPKVLGADSLGVAPSP